MQRPETDPHQYSQLILTKSKNNNCGERIVFSTNGAGRTGQPQTKKLNLDTDLIPSQKLTQNGSLT